jgi:hypothetical protein
MLARLFTARSITTRPSQSPRKRAYTHAGMEVLEPRQMMAAGPLVDDRFENNDTRQIVAARPEGATNSPNLGTVIGTRQILNLALADVQDVYRIRLAAPGTAADFARINFTNANGNLDLRLLGPAGRILRTSLGNTAVERISLDGLGAGVYYLRVNGRNGAMNKYRINMQLPSPPPPTEDAYEDNDTIAQTNARAEGPNSPNLGTMTDRTITSLKLADKYDIFKFTTTATGTAQSFVQINTTEPLNMVLYSAQGQSLRSSEAYQGVFKISLANLPAGQYFLQVTHYALDTSGSFNYALQFDV